MKVLGILCGLLLVTGCSSKKINAYTEPSSRNPSSALSFSPQKSTLALYNTTTRTNIDRVPIVLMISASPNSLMVQGPFTDSATDRRACIISKTLAATKGYSLGDLALLIKGGIELSCQVAVMPAEGDPVASSFSIGDQFQ